MMKKVILSAICLFSLATLQAQQVPLYSNYFFTPYIYNPALSGAKGVTEATLVHRRMWSGVQGSPETSALGINGAIGKQRIGWSAYAYADRTDILSRVGIYGSYAYHLQLSDKNVLSFGMSAGYINQSIDLANVNVGNRLDPVLFITPDDRGTFDLNIGLNLRIDKLQLGFAAPQILGSSIKYSENYGGEVFYQLIRHYIATGQYDLEVQGDRMVLSPFVMIRAAENVPFQYDVGAMFSMKKYGFVGLTYRSEYAVTANFGVHLTPELNVGYAHDFSLNTYASQLGTSNEFMLTYRFGDNSKNERLENEIKKLKENDKRKAQEYEEMIDERLEEFKDEYKRDIEETAKKAAEKAAGEAAAQAGANGQQAGAQGGAAGVAGGRGAQQQGGRGQEAAGGNGQGAAGGQGATGTGAQGYPQESYPSNVEPGTRGFYVVAGVFSSEANAVRMVQNITSQGLQARFFRDYTNSFFYVYLLRFDSYRDASGAKSSRLNGQYNGELWIKIIE